MSERVFKRASVVPLLWGKGGQVLLERGMECERVNVWMFVCSLVQCAHSDLRRSIFRAPGKSNKIRLLALYPKICVMFCSVQAFYKYSECTSLKRCVQMYFYESPIGFCVRKCMQTHSTVLLA